MRVVWVRSILHLVINVTVLTSLLLHVSVSKTYCFIILVDCPLAQSSMDHVGFNDVVTNTVHEACEAPMADTEGFGNPVNVITIEFGTNIRNLIGFVVASFVILGSYAFLDMLFSGMSFNPGYLI